MCVTLNEYQFLLFSFSFGSDDHQIFASKWPQGVQFYPGNCSFLRIFGLFGNITCN